MGARVILTVTGSDRPGLTHALAGAIREAGGNWLESHLSRLGGKYVGAVLVEIDETRLGALETAAAEVDSRGLAVAIVAAGEVVDAAGETALTIELLGQDRLGIVREATAVLAELGANIESLDTRIEDGAWSGERLFRARIAVMLPANLAADRVRDSLEALSGDMMVDFTFGPDSRPSSVQVPGQAYRS